MVPSTGLSLIRAKWGRLKAVNRWGIPHDLENEIRDRDSRPRFATEIRDRDVACVYCGTALLESVPRGSSRKQVATWEHIINDATIVTIWNIARCCNSCNASKGTKELRRWLATDYCTLKGITAESVAAVVKYHLASMDDDAEAGKKDGENCLIQVPVPFIADTMSVD
jgi:hypothetical protein